MRQSSEQNSVQNPAQNSNKQGAETAPATLLESPPEETTKALILTQNTRQASTGKIVIPQMQALPTRKFSPKPQRHIKAWLQTLLANAYTQDCLLCAAESNSGILCSACAADLPRQVHNACPRCASATLNGEICGRCLSKPPHFDTTAAIFAYQFPVDKLIQAFKYAQRLALSHYFGEQLAALATSRLMDQINLVMPLPLAKERLRERGFNQALELARPVAKALRVPLEVNICQRLRNTKAQTQLPWREREKNIRNAFHCSQDLSYQRILLIDDVMTTGASANECARTLKLHGAASVNILIVARTLPK